MIVRKARAWSLILLLLIVCGCTIELRSPIKVSRAKEEPQPTPPPPRVARAPRTVQGEPGKARKESVPVAPSPEEEAPDTEPGLTEVPETPSEPIERATPSPSQPRVSSAENIVIISGEYLGKTRYTVLGKVTVKDVSQNGFSPKEAKEALKVEAFRRYGRDAKGITNVTYQGESKFFGSDRYYEASGDVVTWEEKVPAYEEREAATSAKEPERRVLPRKQPVTEVAPLEATEEPTPVEKKIAPARKPLVAEPAPQEEMSEEFAGTASPANILLLTEIDLIDYKFWTLGKVTVQSKSKDGFTADQANSALKVEAFKQYGGKARGIINVTYEKKKGLLNIRSDKFRSAAGDVVTWKERKAVTRREEPGIETERSYPQEPTAISVSPLPAEERSSEPASSEPAVPIKRAATPQRILVLSPEELVNIPFTLLGRVQAVDDKGRGYDKKRAMNALKVEAFKTYGEQARGITNIDFKRKPGILNLEKFEMVYADVVTWKAEDRVPEVPSARAAAAGSAFPKAQAPAALTTPEAPVPVVPSAEEAGETTEAASSPPEYTTGTTDPETIMILKEDELLTPNYKKLGKVTIKAPTRFGMKEYLADSALKKQALKQFGGKARGIINVQYKRAQGVYAEDKAVPVASATGEAITW